MNLRSAMSLEGQQLGEFEILERLGKGGMGEVYKARQTSIGRFVAVKTLQSSLSVDADYIARFRQEARAAGVLNHPNLVQVYSAGETAGLHWFAMEYVDGESARARLNREGRLDPLEAIAIAIHVATALEYGWRKAALIHRDIKPDNIFLSSDGEVKLGDLGLAKSAGQAPGLTTTGAIMGTPHYMSPEQLECLKDVDLRADIYSLGCTLYHLLCGQSPYVGNSSAAVMMSHFSAPVPDLRVLWSACPAELAAAVGKMMQKRAADRQQSYAEVKADLRRAYEVLSGAALPSAVAATRIPAIAKKRRGVSLAVWVGGAVAVCVATAAVLNFTPWKRGVRSGEAQRQEKQPAARNGAPDTAQAGENPPAAPATGRMFASTAAPERDTPTAFTPAPTIPAPAPQLPVASTPAQSAPALSTPQPSTPLPTAPVPSVTPKPPTEVEKWFARINEPQQDVFQKQVLKPFEAGAADLRARYLAAVDADLAKASAAGRLAEALVWRAERQAFEKTQNVAEDDAATPAGIKVLRAAFRQEMTRLNEDRAAKARALLAPYDAILAKNQTLLTQNQRLDDALLLQTKRDEIALAWLGASRPTAVSVESPADSAKPAPKPVTPLPVAAATIRDVVTLKGNLTFHVVDGSGNPIAASAIPADLRTRLQGLDLSKDSAWNFAPSGLVLAKVTTPKVEYLSVLVGNTWSGGPHYLNVNNGANPDVVCIALRREQGECHLELRRTNDKPIVARVPPLDPTGKIIWLGAFSLKQDGPRNN